MNTLVLVFLLHSLDGKKKLQKLILRNVTIFPQSCSCLIFSLQICGNFHNFGIILAKLIPRCSDPDLPVRQHGIDAIHKLLKIQQRYQGRISLIVFFMLLKRNRTAVCY